MGTLSLRIPDSLHSKLKKLSKKEKVSLNQLINSAVTEKISALETEEYLIDRAKKGDLKKYLKALDKVAD
ncbi:MAG TPA: toxin-antitoxin system HicB family antitoxin [Spirochaetota bacterium]|nr:toxin-antitoxin system HicB family antitoxin [Spirochaetota bacterium]HPI90494.1 toxin-antitoxin system HicB family antitoxin [Spirochaetota bacterium]HPR46938.1 toxin-antitoxin system HicB family antitoxin [Spirochaetota bacterium]